MIEIFRNNLFINSLLLLPYCMVIRIKSLTSPSLYPLNLEEGWFNEYIFSLLGNNPFIHSILAVLLVFIQAVMVNYISNSNKIGQFQSSIPGLLYILLLSYSPNYLTLSPMLIGLTFVLIAVLNLLNTYKRSSSTAQIFNVSFFIALASLFYLPFIIYFLVGFIGLIIMRSFNFNERFQYLLGLTACLFLVFAGSFFKDYHKVIFNEYIKSNIKFSDIYQGMTVEIVNILAINILLIIITIFSYNAYTTKKSIQSQKKIDILYWFLFLSIPTVFMWSHLSVSHFLILAVPLSIFLSMSFLKISNKLFAEIIHFIIVVAIFGYHFELLQI